MLSFEDQIKKYKRHIRLLRILIHLVIFLLLIISFGYSLFCIKDDIEYSWCIGSLIYNVIISLFGSGIVTFLGIKYHI